MNLIDLLGLEILISYQTQIGIFNYEPSRVYWKLLKEFLGSFSKIFVHNEPSRTCCEVIKLKS